ncbi:hypothetical protein FKW77_006979 [Venturia effusa]|uniref:Uncharacterized protein n=1 Tax=Venturia effusa TaxID=50376 RepID=A0A517L3K0_9PEZI|nr:hypothetical protein FKW77_006979 [Venturia effusa]
MRLSAPSQSFVRTLAQASRPVDLGVIKCEIHPLSKNSILETGLDGEALIKYRIVLPTCRTNHPTGSALGLQVVMASQDRDWTSLLPKVRGPEPGQDCPVVWYGTDWQSLNFTNELKGAWLLIVIMAAPSLFSIAEAPNPWSGKRHHDPPEASSQVLRVCKQLQAEGTPILYGENVLYASSENCLQRFLAKMSLATRSTIKHLWLGRNRTLSKKVDLIETLTGLQSFNLFIRGTPLDSYFTLTSNNGASLQRSYMLPKALIRSLTKEASSAQVGFSAWRTELEEAIASAQKLTAPDMAVPNLLGLLAELRLKIIRYCVLTGILQMSGSEFDYSGASSHILRLSKQFYEEAFPVLYGENVFYFDCGKALATFVEGLSARGKSTIRHVCLGTSDGLTTKMAIFKSLKTLGSFSIFKTTPFLLHMTRPETKKGLAMQMMPPKTFARGLSTKSKVVEIAVVLCFPFSAIKLPTDLVGPGMVRYRVHFSRKRAENKEMTLELDFEGWRDFKHLIPK